MREKVLNSFRSGKIQFLITTDVVNRGIDIPNLNYVLNYDFPTNLVTYISTFTVIFFLFVCLFVWLVGWNG